MRKLIHDHPFWARLLFATALVLAANFAEGQGAPGNSNYPSGNGTAGLPAGSVVNGIYQPGLLAQYDFNEGSGTSLTDVSGNGNNGTLAVGTTCGGAGATLPSWNTVANGGGVVFAAANNSCIQLPIALNTAKTFIIAYKLDGSENFSASNIGIQALIAETTVVAGTVSALGFTDSFYATAALGGPSIHSIVGSVWNTGAGKATYEANGGQGTHVVAFVGDTSDHIYHDGVENPFYPHQASANVYAPGAANQYQFGGASFNTSWCGCTIYYAAIYSTVLTPVPVKQTTLAIDQILTNRGIQIPFNGLSIAQDQGVVDGDSITNGYAYGLLTPAANWWTTSLTFQSAFSVWDQSIAGTAIITNLQPNSATGIDTLYSNSGQRNWAFIQGGRNDIVLNSATTAQVVGATYNYCQARRKQGFKCFVGTLIGASTLSAYNAYLRQHWSEFADALIDWAGDPNLGCSTCNTNGLPYWLADTIHPSIYGLDQQKWMLQRGVNAYYGNKDWSTANVYTTTATAAITTQTQSDANLTGVANSTATYNITSNIFPVGARVTCTGSNVAGYNTTFIVLTSTGSLVTAYIGGNTLGAGTGGTCTTPTQLDWDVYVRLAGSATSPSFTLQSACGYYGQDIFLKNENTTSPWVITPYASETIDGAATLTMPVATSGNFPVVQLRAIVTTPSTPVCGWKRMQ